MIDSHCHLNYKGVVEEQSDILARARAVGVEGMLNISTRQSEWADVIRLAEEERDVWASVGIHPHDTDTHPELDSSLLIDAASHRRVIGIGETGLDYYYEHSDRERQKSSFRAHIAAARETQLPVIVHTRDAEVDTLSILQDEMQKGLFSGLIHCFTASEEFAMEVINIGFYISISGIVTFRSAKDLQITATKLPKERLLIETDSPFLAPVPHRGKPCEPAFVKETANFLAQLRGEQVSELAHYTSDNFRTLFKKAI